MSAIRERLVQRYRYLGSQGFIAEVEFYITFSFLVVKVEGFRHRFVVLSFSFQVLRYSPAVAMFLLSTPSTACQSPSACVIARSSVYAYFLEMVVGRSEM